MSDKENNLYSDLEMLESIKVPINRIGVIIGKKGSIKSRIEKSTKTKLTIDSKDGLVTIRPTPEIDDPSLVWTARDIAKAIARGFSEDRAFQLLDTDFYLEIITLEGNTRRLAQLRGRLIGENGRARNLIEMSTLTSVSIQGRTVAIIGHLEEIEIARKAINMLIDGQRHGTVFRFLEKYRTQKKNEAVKIWKKKIELRDDI
ncbi:MAG: KH domain-containing protein [Candidatus Hodarchaeales archaeon]|jgi:ribosomal RNA assembly protein